MDSIFSDPKHLMADIKTWAERLVSAGWIDSGRAQVLLGEEGGSPGDLFATGEKRPLIVGFLGGTGVGKSTLLNRLAEIEVARTGVERPTSREVTVYLHRSLPTEALRSLLPLDKICLASHDHLGRSDVVWIDMPDIDSVETANRELVLTLLPQLDVLVYVVSPDRYRDDSGWQLLTQFGNRHAWLFVMNRWDEGDETQIKDFADQLQRVGFSKPMVLRCDSRPDLSARRPDDFGKLEEILIRLVRSGGIEHLERNRNTALQQRIRTLLDDLVDPGCIVKLRRFWGDIWKQTLHDLEAALELSARALARQVASEGNHAQEQKLTWDLWVRKHLADAIDRLILEAVDLGLPEDAVRHRLEPCRKRMEAVVAEQVRRSLHAALSKPAALPRRTLLWLSARLSYLLPLGTSGWVSWEVVSIYYRGIHGEHEFLGVDFAVHSLLLIGLSWIIPFLFHRLLQPSLEGVVSAAVRKGMRLGFEYINRDVERVLEELGRELEACKVQGRQLETCLTVAGQDFVRGEFEFLFLDSLKDNGIKITS